MSKTTENPWQEHDRSQYCPIDKNAKLSFIMVFDRIYHFWEPIPAKVFNWEHITHYRVEDE